MQRRTALAASVLAAGLCACASVPPATPSAPRALHGTAWMLSGLNSQTLVADAPRPTLRFDGDRVVGSDGCNRFVGYRFGEGAALNLGRDLATTRRTCSDAAQAAADAYGRMLARVAGWRVEGGALVLLDRRGTALASFAPQPSALTDTVWRVTGFAAGDRGWSGLRRSALVTVEFDPEGRVRGFGGCAPYGGVWSVVDARLDVGPLHSAHADCDAFVDLRAQQRAYLRSLGRVTALRRDGDRLELLAGSGEVVATAEAMPRGGPIARR